MSVAQLSGLYMQKSGGPCHHYGVGAPYKKQKNWAHGQSSQVGITSKSTWLDVMCEESMCSRDVSQDDVKCDVLDYAKMCEESMCSRDVASNVSQDDVKCNVLD